MKNSDKNKKNIESNINIVKLDDNTDDPLYNVFNSVCGNSSGTITKQEFLSTLEEEGILSSDPRIQDTIKNLSEISSSEPIDFQRFRELIPRNNLGLIERVTKGDLIIPDFKSFKKEISNIFRKVKTNKGGDVARYIPQLARVNPEHYAISVCTIDGQFYSEGDSEESYCVQSSCKPINYCIGLKLNGRNKVHSHVGREPSGRSFNELNLNKQGLPHNPLINAGAIMSCSLIKPDLPLADRFDYVTEIWKDLSGNSKPGFNNSVYHSEKGTADRNFALAYFMQENEAFPENTDIHNTLDFYFQCCSIELNTKQQATVAATLANSGICPTTDKRVFASDTVKDCLSLMYSCGMYDFSGEYAFTVGLPAKSGVSGVLMIVIPNVAGIAIWSPRLDEMGNSVRGVEFSKELVEKFNFHNYDSLVGKGDRIDPRNTCIESETNAMSHLINAASKGDLNEVRRLVANGTNLDISDYDGRTALHLACSEGHTNITKYLLSKGVSKDAKDRWGNTPLDDAKENNYKSIVDLLK